MFQFNKTKSQGQDLKIKTDFSLLNLFMHLFI